MLESVLPRTEAASRVGGACAVDFCCESTSFHVVLVLAVFGARQCTCCLDQTWKADHMEG